MNYDAIDGNGDTRIVGGIGLENGFGFEETSAASKSSRKETEQIDEGYAENANAPIG